MTNKHVGGKKKKFNFISKQKEASCPAGRDKNAKHHDVRR